MEFTVLIVDDSQMNRMVLTAMLEDKYDLLEADSGQSCLDLVEKHNPDVILLDVNMPGMDGHETCVQLKSQESTSNIPVIFVSGLDTAEERLAGFEAGGDEYLIKPVKEEDILKKIVENLEKASVMKTAKRNANDAMNVAMEAMTSSSELGQVINFVTATLEAHSLEQMAHKICTIAEDFGLTSCAMVPDVKPVYYGCEEGTVEARLLLKSQIIKDRITHFGIRTIVKSDNLCLLIKNMPIEDESRYGRINDHLAVLISIADGRIQTIKANLALKKNRHTVLNRVIDIAENQIEQIKVKFSQHDNHIRNTMLNMTAKLETELFRLGLEEDQEQALMELAYSTQTSIEETRGSSKDLEASLGQILKMLYELLNKNE
ncbi:MAG: response regulator [Saccharospirillaceae bacterium]|nr:response regulator [Pseudomonadales bacterium]NRB81635.1 response regulator [Saccharospirillaceae bacterium]